MRDNERLFRRATKLARLAESANPHESRAAASMAIAMLLSLAGVSPNDNPMPIFLPAQSWGKRLAEWSTKLHEASWSGVPGKRVVVFHGAGANKAVAFYEKVYIILEQKSHIYIQATNMMRTDGIHPYHRKGPRNPITRRLDWIDGVLDVLVGSPDKRSRRIKSPEDYRAGRRAAKHIDVIGGMNDYN